MCRGPVHQRYRRLVADIAMWSHLAIVSAPTFAFSDRVVEAHESVLVQALRPELSVEAFDERVVRRRTRQREIQRDALHVRPQVEVAGDELAPLVHPDRRWIADLTADAGR